jgi:hypothetical protein
LASFVEINPIFVTGHFWPSSTQKKRLSLILPHLFVPLGQELFCIVALFKKFNPFYLNPQIRKAKIEEVIFLRFPE